MHARSELKGGQIESIPPEDCMEVGRERKQMIPEITKKFFLPYCSATCIVHRACVFSFVFFLCRFLFRFRGGKCDVDDDVDEMR
jgi:NAD-dependent dihydropyrimidine dehydrogenase PreA subunit